MSLYSTQSTLSLPRLDISDIVVVPTVPIFLYLRYILQSVDFEKGSRTGCISWNHIKRKITEKLIYFI